MDKKMLIFENLKMIKDYWSDTAIGRLDSSADLISTEFVEEYKRLQMIIHNTEDKEAFRKVMNDIIEGVIHSILVMVDGGDKLAENLILDLIDWNTKESFREQGALHEDFFRYLIDVEE